MARNQRLFDVLQGLSEHLKRELIKSVSSKGKIATGKGIASIEIGVKEFMDSTVITESHEFYMSFVDRGRKKGGKRVPISALEEWLRAKNFSWAAGNIRGAAFAVQTNIFKFGIKPTRWLSEVLESQEQRIAKDVENASIQQMDIIIDNLVKRFGQLLNKSGPGITITT